MLGCTGQSITTYTTLRAWNFNRLFEARTWVIGTAEGVSATSYIIHIKQFLHVPTLSLSPSIPHRSLLRADQLQRVCPTHPPRHSPLPLMHVVGTHIGETDRQKHRTTWAFAKQEQSLCRYGLDPIRARCLTLAYLRPTPVVFLHKRRTLFVRPPQYLHHGEVLQGGFEAKRLVDTMDHMGHVIIFAAPLQNAGAHGQWNED